MLRLAHPPSLLASSSSTSAPFPRSSRQGAALFTRALLCNLIPSRSLHSIARLMDILPVPRMRSEPPFIRCESSVLDIAKGFYSFVETKVINVPSEKHCNAVKGFCRGCNAPSDISTHFNSSAYCLLPLPRLLRTNRL